ncbi:MAG: glycosyltransferase [Armatimonadota bacterium]
MKIIFVAHGNEPIPPNGWGAVEQVIWQYTIRLRALGHEVILVNKKRWGAIFTTIWYCLTKRIDVVHCHSEKPIQVLATVLRRPLVVSTVHHPLNSDSLDKSELKALRRCNHAPYHLILRADIANLIKKRNPSAICAVLPNGVEVHEFQTNLVGNGKAVCIGRIQARKRQDDVARILAPSGIICDIIGPDYGEIEPSPELKERMIGSWDRDMIHQRLCEYSCLILLSTSEGQPLVVVEALAAGLPVVISSACTGNLDLSQPFIHLVESDDQLIPAVTKAIAQRDEMTAQIRRYAEENFDYDSLVQRYLDQLQDWREVQ